MTELVLIRHGETDFNRDMKFLGHMPLPLNEKGREQAEALRNSIANEQFDAVYCSDLKRCTHTSEIIFPGREITYSRNLREMDFGIFEGLTYKEIKDQHSEELKRWEQDRFGYMIEGGESFSSMAVRVLSEIREITARGEGKYAVVSHSGCIRTILAFYLLGGIRDTWRFQVDHCRASRLMTGSKYSYLKSLNEK